MKLLKCIMCASLISLILHIIWVQLLTKNIFEKILTSFAHLFEDKVDTLETFKNLGEFTLNELIDDLQAYEIHHFLLRKGLIVYEKKKIIALKTIKGNDSNIDMDKVMASDKSSILDREVMAFLMKRFTIFFYSEKNPSSGFRRDSLRQKDFS